MTVAEPDPTDLFSNLPALVDVHGQGTVFLAHASTLDNGWLRVRQWNGTTAKLPPHRIRQVRYLETESHGDRGKDGMRPKRIADREWRETAREWVEADNDHPEGTEEKVIA